MSNFKPGDIVIGPTPGNRWKFIGTVDGSSYCVPLNDGSRDVVEFVGALSDTWKLAPKPFFEVGKRYQQNYGGYVWQCVNVFEHDGSKFANLFDADHPIHMTLWDETHFRSAKKVK